MERSSIGIIILGILAVAGFGLSGYMFITNEILAPPNNQNIVVGFWENLDENTDFVPYDNQQSFLFQFKDQKIINNNYMTISNSNTTFSLLKSGLYKISCNVIYSGIIAGFRYSIDLIEDTAVKEVMINYLAPTGSSGWFQLSSSIYILADGSHEYRVHASSSGDDFVIGDTIADYNQLIIEYVRN